MSVLKTAKYRYELTGSRTSQEEAQKECVRRGGWLISEILGRDGQPWHKLVDYLVFTRVCILTLSIGVCCVCMQIQKTFFYVLVGILLAVSTFECVAGIQYCVN